MYRGRIGAILIAALVTGLFAVLTRATMFSLRPFNVMLHFYLVFPFIFASALFGIIVVMIPAEALARRALPNFAPVIVIACNSTLTWFAARSVPVATKLGVNPVVFAIFATLLWLLIDRLFGKTLKHA